MKRRQFLATAGVGLTGAIAGCSGLFETTTSREPPLVENRPSSPYIPTHREGMSMVGMGKAGDIAVVLFYSYAHRFWVIENEDGEYVAEVVPIDGDDAVHLMATPFDPETNTVVPDTGLSLEITRDGTLVSQEVIYPMLSQRMGFHYGANFPLDGDGVYDVAVSVGGLGDNVSRFGSYRDRLGDPGSVEISFDYSESERNELAYELLEDRQGQTGSLPPMAMEGVPVGTAPSSLPGESLGAGTAGGAQFVAAAISEERFGETPYLAVSPRTPHNGLVLPGMAVSATVARDGDTAFDGRLTPGLDPEIGFHYGAPVDDLSAEDGVELVVDTPPLVARHEGYETAFLEMGTVALSE
ncbi:MAG: DUF7350 domain-containing protein [Halobacteriota archaeon]